MEEKFLTVEQLRNKAHEQYINLLKENKLTALLRAIGYFTDQTIANDVLILNANPNATCVKRMKEWNYYNRKVLKSEKAIKVISPVKEIHNEIITDENGNTYSQDVEKLVNEVGFLFDISQTEGVDYPYLNSNKETLSSFFEEVKKSLENTSKGFTFEYVNQDENSKIDWEHKTKNRLG